MTLSELTSFGKVSLAQVAKIAGHQERLCVHIMDGNLLRFRDLILDKLLQTQDPHSPLLQLWEFSIIDGDVLLLPADAATQIAEAHLGGYHSGVWHLATEYEALLSTALLTNSSPSPSALGQDDMTLLELLASAYQQPKSFSAWPRRHDASLYQKASRFRADLPQDLCQISAADRSVYVELIRQWHQSVTYISQISGDTRLNECQLHQLWVACSVIRD